MRPTREQCGQHYRSPIWPYSGWGLPCHGMLPPARCALTAPFHPYRSPEMNQEDLGGIFSVALSIGSRRPGVTWHPALRSPDFPPLGHGERGREAAVWPTPVTIIPVYQSLPVSFWKPQACAGLRFPETNRHLEKVVAEVKKFEKAYPDGLIVVGAQKELVGKFKKLLPTALGLKVVD